MLRKKEPDDFVNVFPLWLARLPPSGNFPLEFQDEASLVCTRTARNESLLAVIPPHCGQDGKYGSVLPPLGRRVGRVLG